MRTKSFHLGDVLSITTGRLVSTRHIDGVYEILDFMTGESLFTHQLPRAADACKPYLLKQFPQLSGVDASKVNPKNWKNWLKKEVDKYGEYLPVEPLPKGAYEAKNPIQELVEMAPNKPIVVVKS